MMVLIVNTGLKLKKKMGDTKFGKKYILFIYGTLLFDIMPIGATLANLINTPTARLAYLVSTVLTIPGAWLIYVGLRQEDS